MKIEARDIVFRTGDADILRDVGLTVFGGEVVGLIGPNGAGKTTLLRILANLLEPAGGEVRYDGKAIGKIPASEFARSVSYLAQGNLVHWSLRVEAVVALGRLPYANGFRAFSADDVAAVQVAMAEADILPLRDRNFDTLSGGEQRRVLLARALAVRGKILLADEPGAALDPYHHLQIMELLARTASSGVGVVVVLHDLSMAARFCSRLVLLDQGRVVADGTPDEVLSDRHVADVYRVSLERGGSNSSFVIPRDRL